MTQVAKTIEMSEETAFQLAELAQVRGTTEDLLVEEGLSLLFRSQTGVSTEELLVGPVPDEQARLAADVAALPKLTAKPISWEGAQVLTSTPVPSGRSRWTSKIPYTKYSRSAASVYP